MKLLVLRPTTGSLKVAVTLAARPTAVAAEVGLPCLQVQNLNLTDSLRTSPLAWALSVEGGTPQGTRPSCVPGKQWGVDWACVISVNPA